ncbi:MAG: response regulator [Lachnospiraceae bacterium]|nr:response regulator [Lachnospiraceae bacterium]
MRTRGILNISKSNTDDVKNGMAEKASHVLSFIMIVSVLSIVAYVIFFFFGKTDNYFAGLRCKEITEGWKIIYEDGSSENITLPFSTKAEKGSVIVTETLIPDDVTDKDYVAFRTFRQNAKIYVGDELRCDYSMYEEEPYRRDLVSLYIYAPINSHDAGRTLRIESVRYEKEIREYSRVFYGDLAGIISNYLRSYRTPLLFAALFLLMSILFIIAGLVIYVVLKTDIRLDYMGWALLSVVLWNFSQSDFRDLLYPNIKALSMVPAFGLMTMPLPIGLYYNNIQNKRYYRVHVVMFVLYLAHFLYRLSLQLRHTYDFYDSIYYDFMMIGVYIIAIGYTLFMDLKRGFIKEYTASAIAFLVLVFGAVGQMVYYILNSNYASATFFSFFVSMVAVLSFFEGINRINNVRTQAKVENMANSLKQEFLANMSHEIRTPINGVLGMNEAILRESTESNIIEYATDVDNAGRLLLSIINDILDYSKLDSGRMNLVNEDYNIRNVIATCNSIIENKVKDKNLSLVLEADPEMYCEFYGDDVRIQQMMINLLTNAVKYTDNGSVTLKLSTADIDKETAMLDIRVKDTGIGIREDDKDKLFTAFARMDENRNRNVEGTGLGLNITAKIAELMNGKIEVESEYGKGSEFIIKIPQKIRSLKKLGNVDLKEATVNAVVKYMDGGIYAPNGRILVIDDVNINLKVITSFLRNSGISIDLASSGDEGIELVKIYRYHMIFLDHMMPGKDGIETLKEIRELKDNPNTTIPVIMLTANVSEGLREKYISYGFADYIAKPVSYTEINAIVKKYLPNEAYLQNDDGNKADDKAVPPADRGTPGPAVKPGDGKEGLIDRETGIDYCAGDQDIYYETLKAFLEENMGDKLDACYKKDDWDNYRITAHAIKSTSRSIGAVKLSEFAKQMEEYAKDDKVVQIVSRHESFISDYRDVIGEIRGMLRDRFLNSED